MNDGFTCTACGRTRPLDDPSPFRCPAANDEDVDHVLEPVRLPPVRVPDRIGSDVHPFVAFADVGVASRLARRLGWTEDRFAALVDELDDGVARAAGTGVHETPFTRGTVMLSTGHPLWTKDETEQAGGSHKIRHLFGVMLWLLVMRRSGRLTGPPPELAIASCGNAALAAAIVARAAKSTLNVYIPTDANADVVDAIRSHGARTHVCPRRSGEPGDPCMHAFRHAVLEGQLPFTCQGPENGLVVDGGLTLGFEMIGARDAWPLSDVVVQVGGGALASAVASAFHLAVRAGAIAAEPRLHTVQTTGAFPLLRAYDAFRRAVRPEWGSVEAESVGDRLAHAAELARTFDAIVRPVLPTLARARSRYMTPWPTTPTSIATGILDDECYDWRHVLIAMLRTGGVPLVATEAELEAAWTRAQNAGVHASATGAAGVAGAEQLAAARAFGATANVAVLLTGR